MQMTLSQIKFSGLPDDHGPALRMQSFDSGHMQPKIASEIALCNKCGASILCGSAPVIPPIFDQVNNRASCCPDVESLIPTCTTSSALIATHARVSLVCVGRD